MPLGSPLASKMAMAASICARSQRASWPRLQNHVDLRFRRATDFAEAACLDDLGELCLSGLRTQSHTHLLRKRHRDASHGRKCIGDASDRSEIVFGRVAGERL